MNTRAGLLALLLLCACQREQWELPAALGTPQRSSNYSAAAELPPSIPLLLPLDAADTSGCVVPPLVLSSRRWIMATSGGSLLSVSPTRVDWLFRLPGGATATSLAADSSRVYALATDGMLYALSYEGKLLWSTAAFAPLDSGAAYAHLLPFSDGVLAASLAGELLCFSGDGRLRWHSNRAAPIGRLPAAFADAVALSSGPGVPGETDTLVLLDASTGQQRWARALPLTAISSGPVVGDRFLAVAGIRYNPESSPAAVLHAFSPTGELLWSQLLPAPARFLATADSSLYVGIGRHGGGQSHLRRSVLFAPREATLEAVPASGAYSATNRLSPGAAVPCPPGWSARSIRALPRGWQPSGGPFALGGTTTGARACSDPRWRGAPGLEPPAGAPPPELPPVEVALPVSLS
jgi:outer membrane protein assembly factor BamB